MIKYKDRFDDAILRVLSESICHLPPGSDSSKVRQQEPGKHQLGPQLTQLLDEVWQKQITESLGFKNYASLVEAAER